MVKFVSPIVRAHCKKIVWLSYQSFENRKQFNEATNEEKDIKACRMISGIMQRRINLKYQSLFPSKDIKEMNDLKKLIEINLIHESDVVCCAISTTAKKSVLNCKFQSTFIDDAQQSNKIYSIIPLIHQPERLVLLGDSKQLHSYANKQSKRNHPIPFRSLYKKLMQKKIT